MQNAFPTKISEINATKYVKNLPSSKIIEQKSDFLQVPAKQSLQKDNYQHTSGPNYLSFKTAAEKLTPTSSMRLCTSSLSPRPSKQEDFYKKIFLPMPGFQAALLHSDCLLDYEIPEIRKYEEVYYLGEKNNKSLENTDCHGRYKPSIGDHLDYRYEIIESLGKGTFGNVFKCFDHKDTALVAVKIMRNVPKIQKQVPVELKNLTKIRETDLKDSKCIVKMKNYFNFRNHVCICFELLSMSLYQFLRKSEFLGVSKSLLKRISVQILIGLRHIHEIGLIHCDLKPENILLKQENKSSIKIIDFGSAVYNISDYPFYIQSRFYRAPEVILGVKYDNKIDIWSFGCILFELLTGLPLFAEENEKDQLKKIIQVIGLPSEDILRKAKRRKEVFKQSPSIEISNFKSFAGFSIKEIVNDPELFEFLMNCLQ